MSAVTELPPVVFIPTPVGRRAKRTATVLAFPPSRLKVAPVPQAGGASLRQVAQQTARAYPVGPAVRRAASARRASTTVRLTRRGYLAVGLLAAALTAGLVWLAHASVPPGPPATPPSAGSNVAVVTVREGDTLWSIASRIAPQRDPRRVVDTLERINHLNNPMLQPGQVLRTR